MWGPLVRARPGRAVDLEQGSDPNVGQGHDSTRLGQGHDSTRLGQGHDSTIDVASARNLDTGSRRIMRPAPSARGRSATWRRLGLGPH